MSSDSVKPATGTEKLKEPQESWKRISPGYQAEQERLHATTPYGQISKQFAPIVSQIIERMEVTHLLDYGCGAECNLAKNLRVKHKLTYQAYDPAVARFCKEPLPAQLVCCIDVLEHVEPEYLTDVLDDLTRLTEAVIFLSVCTCPALKVLTDGRNAHLTQRPIEWWLPKFYDRWELQTVQAVSDVSYFFIGYAKPRIEKPNGEALV